MTKCMVGAAALVLALGAAIQISQAAETNDSLILPNGFHASVVHPGVGAGARHIAVRANGDLFISSNARKDAPHIGITVVRMGKDHKPIATERFAVGKVENGTAIRFYKGALYAATNKTLYRFTFNGNEMVPGAEPQVVVDGFPGTGHENLGLDFDGKGRMYVQVAGQGNICNDPNVPKTSRAVGLMPCPQLVGRAGVWTFDPTKMNQKFPADGEQIATGVRDMMAVSWSHTLNGFYGVMQDRNGTAHAFGDAVSEGADADSIAEEMHRLDKGANLGWPYSYYDMSQKARILAPEYGGNGTKPIADGTNYSTPVVNFPAHSSPLDLQFYEAKQFPKEYRGGAFVVMHGGGGAGLLPGGYHGYNVQFVPVVDGKLGTPQPFAEGLAGPDASYKNGPKTMARPSGAAVAPDGSLYVVEEKKGKVWRISYDGKN